MSIVARMAEVRARLQQLNERSGSPHYQHSIRIIQSSIPDGAIVPVETITEISPNPRVEPVPTREVGTLLSNDVFLSEKDLKVSFINGGYSESDLLGEWEVDGHRGYRVLRIIPETTTYTAFIQTPSDRSFSGNFPS